MHSVCCQPPMDEDEPKQPSDVLLLEAVVCTPFQAQGTIKYMKTDSVLTKVKDWILRGWPSIQLNNTFTPYEKRKTKVVFALELRILGKSREKSRSRKRVSAPTSARK
ncbi:hypothetical protein MRX96_017187 [Rhipicephalus microplus]